MGALTLRLPNTLQERAKELAKQEGISLNQFITLVISQKIATFDAIEYMQQRGKDADRSALEAFLATAKDDPPSKIDQL